MTPQHPLFEEVKEGKTKFMTLSMLDLHIKIGKTYKNTDEIATDFRTMIAHKMMLNQIAGDPEEYSAIE